MTSKNKGGQRVRAAVNTPTIWRGNGGDHTRNVTQTQIKKISKPSKKTDRQRTSFGRNSSPTPTLIWEEHVTPWWHSTCYDCVYSFLTFLMVGPVVMASFTIMTQVELPAAPVLVPLALHKKKKINKNPEELLLLSGWSWKPLRTDTNHKKKDQVAFAMFGWVTWQPVLFCLFFLAVLGF